MGPFKYDLPQNIQENARCLNLNFIILYYIIFLGQFLNKHGKIQIPERDPDPTVAKLAIRGPRVAPYSVKAKLRRRRNMALKQHVPCWHVGNNAHGLLEGEYTDYLVSRLSYRGQNKVEKRTPDHKPDKSKRTWINEDTDFIEI